MAASLRGLLAYLETFELAYAQNQWHLLEKHFTPDASYEVIGGAPFAGVWKPRGELIAQFEKICREFDQRFDERIVAQVGRPKFKGDEILFGWKATYKLAGAADFVLIGDSSARMVGDQIVELKDIISDADCMAAVAYFATHANKLKP